MRNIKKFKSKISCILIIALFVPIIYSCTSENVDPDSDRVFDLTTYKEGVKVLHSLPQIDYNKYKISKTINKKDLVNAINNQVGENILNPSVFDYSFNEKTTSVNALDAEILLRFSSDWENVGIDKAIINLNIILNDKNVDNITFEKYNNFSNVLLLSGIDFQNQSEKTNYQSKVDGSGWGCAIKVAAFTLSTVGVGTTCVPNPVTTWACPLAISQSILAYAAMLLECTDIDD